jgi:hypothetical protein
MKNWFRFCLTCLGIAIALRLAFEAVTGQGVEKPKAANGHAYILPGRIGAEWNFHDESRVWLEVRSSSSEQEWYNEGYKASCTYVLVKDAVPVVRKLGENRYEIAFKSEVAKDLP